MAQHLVRMLVRTMSDCIGEDVPKMGFGGLFCVRNAKIDIESVKRMVDMFLGAGYKCFDSAYAYAGVEDILSEALVRRYPRDAYLLTEKITAWKLEDEGAARRHLEESYANLGVNYLDYLMLHNVSTMGDRIQIYEDHKAWGLMQEYKDANRVRHIGFSHHDNAQVLDEVLRQHPEVDFVLLPINYLDWDDEIIQGRKNYEVARAHGKPVMVMKPLNGGLLVDLPPRAASVLEEAGVDPVALAYEFCMSLEDIITIFTTMNDVQQAEHDIAMFNGLAPLSSKKRDLIAEVVDIMHDTNIIECSHCRYCMQLCPQRINIPWIFSDMNQLSVYGNQMISTRNYNLHVQNGGKASSCIKCGACEEVCPQKLPIPSLLAEAQALFES